MSIQSLLIEAKPVGQRFTVVIDGQTVPLTLKSLKYLVILSMRHFTVPPGWVQMGDFDAGDNVARYMYRLKHEVHVVLPGLVFIENNKLGYYRLLCEGKVLWSKEGLKELPDHECKLFFDKLEMAAALQEVN